MCASSKSIDTNIVHEQDAPILSEVIYLHTDSIYSTGEGFDSIFVSYIDRNYRLSLLSFYLELCTQCPLSLLLVVATGDSAALDPSRKP